MATFDDAQSTVVYTWTLHQNNLLKHMVNGTMKKFQQKLL